MDLQQLRAKRKSIQDAIDDILTKSEAEANGALTDEQDAEVKRLEGEFDALSKRIELLERNETRKAFMKDRPGSPVPKGQPGERQRIEVLDRELDPKGGFKHVAHFAHDVRAACISGGRMSETLASYLGDLKAAPSGYQNEGVGQDGGFLVPQDFRSEIWDKVYNEDDILSSIVFDPTASNQVSLNADETTPWGSTGVRAYWRGEADQMTATKLVTKQRTVRLNELYAFVLSGDELLDDAPLLANRLTVKAGNAIRWKAVDALFYGTGVGQPLGWFNANCLVSVAKESGQAADTVVAGNVAKMLSRLLGAGPRTFWAINSDVLPQIMVMTIGNQPIWTPPNSGFKEAPGGYLLGRPVKLTEHCKTVGDQGDIQLIDPEGYLAINKAGGTSFDSSIHLYFDYGVTAFRWTFRLGGEPYLSAAVTPPNSALTKSHFVVLDARA